MTNLDEEDFLAGNTLLMDPADVDEAETEEAEEEDDEDSFAQTTTLGKRLSDANSQPVGKRLRQNVDITVVDLGNDDEDDEADEDEDDDRESVVRRPYSKNDSKQFMSKGNRSHGQFPQGDDTNTQQNTNLQRLLDSMDRKTKSELFSDALEMCGSELFQGHESWRDQLLLKACRLQPAFVSSINELAHQSGSYNTPVVLSGDEEEDEVDDVEDVDDKSSFSGAAIDDEEDQNVGDDLNLVGDDANDDLELGDLSDL